MAKSKLKAGKQPKPPADIATNVRQAGVGYKDEIEQRRKTRHIDRDPPQHYRSK